LLFFVEHTAGGLVRLAFSLVLGFCVTREFLVLALASRIELLLTSLNVMYYTNCFFVMKPADSDVPVAYT